MELEIIEDTWGMLEQVDVLFQEGKGQKLIRDAIKFRKLTGIILAKSLYLDKNNWNNPDESFRDYAVREYNLASENVKRYINVWEAILEAPEKMRPLLVRKPMEELIPIGTNIANDSIDPSDDEWNTLKNAVGYGEISDTIREMTGREKKEYLRLYFDSDTGDITSWKGDQYEYIGWFDVERMDVEQVQKSIFRILNKAGIKEKNNAR